MRDKPWFTTGEAAELIGVTHVTVYRWVKSGTLRAQPTPGGWNRIDRADLIEFLQKYNLEVQGLRVKPQKKILIIDDSPNLLKLIKRDLERKCPQLKVETAASVEKGVMLCGRIEPDLVVLDWYFPEGSAQGRDALKFIRAAGSSDIKVIGMSGREDARGKMFEAGAFAFLTKPFTLQELKNIIFRELRGGTTQRRAA